MELKKYNANHTQVLKINQIVRTISETHKFDKDKLIAINTSDVENGVMGNGTLTFVDELKGQFKKTIVKDDILFSEIRPANRRFAKVTTKNTKDYVVSTKLMVLRKYNEDVDLEYFYYCLTNQPFLDILQRRAENRIGSFPQITFDLLSEYAFPIPPISEQKRISSVISTLDKKIALNRQINQNLEAMAKQLYDYWFMQFDFPNEEGKPYKSSGGEMVWNEKLKREIPKEWEVLNLGQITTSYQQGLIRSNNQLSDSSEFGYLKMGDLDGKGQYSLQKLARTNATSEEVFLFSLHKGDFLINVRNSKEIVGKTCLIDYVEENTLFNHMLVRMSFDKVTSFYMNLLFNTDFMYRAMDGLKQGTTTVIALYQEDLYRLPIVVPTKNVMDTFSIIEKSILNQKELLTNEIISLIKQRDELLPLLMNGQVSVNSDLSDD